MRQTSSSPFPLSGFLGLVALLIPAPAAASRPIHYVDNLGQCEDLWPCYATITEAVDAAGPTEAVEVFPGVYAEAVVFGPGKDGVVLRAHVRGVLPVIQGRITLKVRGVQVRGFVLEGGLASEGFVGGIEAVVDGNVLKAPISLVGCQSSRFTNNQLQDGGITIGMSAAACTMQGNVVRGGSLVFGGADNACNSNVVEGNVVRDGGIVFGVCRPLGSNRVVGNRVLGGDIVLGAVNMSHGNLVQRNVVRGGGIRLSMAVHTPMGVNTVESNFVSDSPGDGILLASLFGGQSVVKQNTSVANAGCDINDTRTPPFPANTWAGNRFQKKCGEATD